MSTGTIEVTEGWIEEISLAAAPEQHPVPVGTAAHYWLTFQPTWLDRAMGRIAEAHAQPGKAGLGMTLMRKLVSPRVLSSYTAHRFASRYMRDAGLFYKSAGVYHELMLAEPEEATLRLYGAELSADASFRQHLAQDTLAH